MYAYIIKCFICSDFFTFSYSFFDLFTYFFKDTFFFPMKPSKETKDDNVNGSDLKKIGVFFMHTFVDITCYIRLLINSYDGMECSQRSVLVQCGQNVGKAEKTDRFKVGTVIVHHVIWEVDLTAWDWHHCKSTV